MKHEMTVVAVATGPSAGGVGILRLSGPHALEVVRPLVREVPWPPGARRAYLISVSDRAGQVLDEGLFLYFAAPRSFTGEEVVELQLHGSPALLALVQREILKDGRVRAAHPGEFTRRAFLNGRMDLARAEAVADLVSAEGEAAVRGAAAQLRGEFSRRLREVSAPLLQLRADIEGILDFPDESEGAEAGLAERLSAVSAAFRQLSLQVGRGQWLRRGAKVALFGPANAGKSTLFNFLLEEERALVDEAPGTTRDVLYGALGLQGLSVSLVDTAGLRKPEGRVEERGIARGLSEVVQCDLAVLLVFPDSGPEEVQAWRALASPVPTVVVRGKSDLGGPSLGNALSVSGRTGEGVDALRAEMVRELWKGASPESAFAVSERIHQRVLAALEAAERAEAAFAVSTLEVVAGELLLAHEAVAEISGAGASTELLDEVFRRFCIGK